MIPASCLISSYHSPSTIAICKLLHLYLVCGSFGCLGIKVRWIFTMTFINVLVQCPRQDHADAANWKVKLWAFAIGAFQQVWKRRKTQPEKVRADGTRNSTLKILECSKHRNEGRNSLPCIGQARTMCLWIPCELNYVDSYSDVHSVKSDSLRSCRKLLQTLNYSVPFTGYSFKSSSPLILYGKVLSRLFPL